MPPRRSITPRTSLPKSTESPIDTIYSSAVEAFVRKDHVKTYTTLCDLIELLQRSSKDTLRQPWHHPVRPPTASADLEDRYIKTFKLYIGAHASLYTDQPGGSTLPFTMKALVPPTPPGTVLDSLYQTCQAHFPSELIPPALMSTFILASLKLQPQSSALAAAHQAAESWLGSVPTSFLDRIARSPSGNAAERKNMEALREGYLRVLELFVGEVLGRETEWEMARAILDGDSLLPSKRREALYRHIRTLEQRTENPSLSSSGLLPSPTSSGILPSPSGQKTSSNASSTSSSELTARPRTSGSHGLGTLASPADQRAPRSAPSTNGTARQGGGPPSTESDSTLPSRIIINRNPRGSRDPRRGSVRDKISIYTDLALSYLPGPVQHLLRTVGPFLSIPIPIISLLMLYLLIRRRRLRGRGSSTASNLPAEVVMVGAGAGGIDAVEAVRKRLARARQQGWGSWVVWFFRWWIQKVLGVWKLGTTISYV